MKNWKLRYSFDSNDQSDYVEINGHIADPSNDDFTVDLIPFGNLYAAGLRTSGTDTFGPVSNQVPGICNGTFTLAGGGSNINRTATTLTGEGSGAKFNYGFHADGTLDYIRATTGGSGYKVGDKLSITTTTGHGSQVIQFHLVDGSNATEFTVQIKHDTGEPLPFAVHRARVGAGATKTLQVYDYRSQQVFPRPLDKLLDKYPGAAAAYSLRKLRSAYLGPAIRVRANKTGSPEMDIYFDAQGNLDTQALLDFVGPGTNANVTRWYDQSGNGNDAAQGTNAAQPKIVASDGTLNTLNGKPCLDFDGDDKFSLNHSDLYGQARFDAYFHIQGDDTQYLMFSQSSSAGNHSFAVLDGSDSTALASGYNYNTTDMYVNGVNMNFVSGTTTRDDLHTAFITNGAEHSTGAIIVHEGAHTTNWTNFKVSAYSSYSFSGKMTEMVLYTTDQSANRANIEKDMALHSGAFEVEDAPLLDAYGGAHAAYSLRKLNSDYTGAAVRVRRVSDSTELDIGFKSDGTLDTDAADAFWDGSNLVAKTWYDQSGNGNNITQTATSAQPLLYNVNGLLTGNGLPILRFVPNDGFPFDNTGLDIGNLSSFIVCKYSNTTGDQQALSLSGTSGDARWFAPRLVGGNFNYTVGTSNSVGTATATTANNLHTCIAGATQTDTEAFLNGTSVGTKALGSGIDSNLANIGSRGNGSYMNGQIQEVVVYPSDQSARRIGIERNISNYYDL